VLKEIIMKDHKDLIMPATLPGPHEMDMDPITLAFHGDVEEAFLDDFFNNSLRLVRISLLAGIFLYGFFSILDAQLAPEVKGKLWFILCRIDPCFYMGVCLYKSSIHLGNTGGLDYRGVL
jgi:hypothetical protein